MYRAKVEAISGTKILAGGKWLQCIGNKTFHVGELAWTDGRCAYGNHYTPQQPLVITAPKVDEGIPIMFLSGYCTYDKRLKDVETRTASINVFDRIINDKKGNVYLTASYRRTFGDNFEPLGIIAANVDENNNFYAIRMRNVGHYYHAEIEKNGNVVDSFIPDSYVEQVEARVLARCTYLPGEIALQAKNWYTDFWIYWSFIEDENNWALIMAINAPASNETHEKVGKKRSGFGGVLDVYRYNYHRTAEHTTFLITQDGVTQLHHIETDTKVFGATDWVDAYTGAHHLIDEEIIPQDSDGIDAPDKKIPIQDGYYYIINDVSVPEPRLLSGWCSAEFIAHLSLFAPSGEKITEGDFLLLSSITICRLGIGRYLIGIDLEFTPNVYSPIEDIEGSYIHAGLYLCEQGVLTMLRQGNCTNHRLRPMKKINDWPNRIRKIT